MNRAAAFLVLGYVILAWGDLALSLPQNLTTVLNHYHEFSYFNMLLSETGVAGEINRLPAATVFVPENNKLLRDMVFQLRADPSAGRAFSDICRFHVSRNYIDLSRLRSSNNNNNSTGAQIDTLLPGRSFDVIVDDGGELIIAYSNDTSLAIPPNILGNFHSPWSLNVYTIDRVLNPFAVRAATANSSSPQTGSSTPPRPEVSAANVFRPLLFLFVMMFYLKY